jgi:RNA 2',3'-cyclic 3'-phosphodiesterase
MTGPASVGADERLRLFLALRLPEPVLDAVETWQREHLEGVRTGIRPGIRVAPRGHLHITVAFLGHRPAGELPAVLGELRAAASCAPADLRLAPARYRETRSVAMLVLDDLGGGAAAFAADVQARLERIGAYRREGRPWLPHVTVARFRDRPGLRLEPPAMGTFVPSDAAAYLSRLRPGGAQYEVLESVVLKSVVLGG